MARPTTYAAPRIDTKVRLTAQHRDLLIQMGDETGKGRNRLIEDALDEFFGLKTRARRPRLQRPPTEMSMSQGASRTPARVAPGMPQVGAAHAAQTDAAVAARTPRPKVVQPTTKHAPRRPR